MAFDKTRPSKTADLAAAIRALDRKRNVPPVFDDCLAFALCSPLWRAVIRYRPLTWLVVTRILGRLSPIMPAITVRAQFGEECIEGAVAAGVRQLVIVGAGYDTFTLRRQDLMSHLTVYELDLAATQAEKKRRMERADLSPHPHTRYVSVDLETQDMFAALTGTGFDAARPAVFAWFAVSFYLDLDTVRATLKNIADNVAPGSMVLFDYLSDPAFTSPSWQALQAGCAKFVARRGEAWITGFNPAEMTDFLQELGYAEVENLAPDTVGNRFLARHPHIVYPEFLGLCRAVTPAAG